MRKKNQRIKTLIKKLNLSFEEFNNFLKYQSFDHKIEAASIDVLGGAQGVVESPFGFDLTTQKKGSFDHHIHEIPTTHPAICLYFPY